jgi:Asp/Glu/hydantoin racemase
MRIAVINPNTSAAMTAVIEAGARGATSAGVEILALQPSYGPRAIDSAAESYLAAAAVMELAPALHLLDRCASVRACGLSTAEVDADPAGAARAILAEARRAVDDDRAEVICLGCGGMAELDATIAAALGVPVVDGVAAAVRLAQAIVGMGLRTSKVCTFAHPAPNEVLARGTA